MPLVIDPTSIPRERRVQEVIGVLFQAFDRAPDRVLTMTLSAVFHMLAHGSPELRAGALDKLLDLVKMCSVPVVETAGVEGNLDADAPGLSS